MKYAVKSPAFIFFIIAFTISLIAGLVVDKTWVVEKVILDVQMDETGKPFRMFKGSINYLGTIGTAESEPLWNLVGQGVTTLPSYEKLIVKYLDKASGEIAYYELTPKSHFGVWSLLPAASAVGLCLLTRMPIPSLLMGIVTGAFLMQKYNVTDLVLLPGLSTEGAAGILLLYLWLLGGILGIWSRNGAAKAFAEFMTERFVRGPRSAKFVAWLLGVLFFQGGTMSSVLVGTTVRPIADKERVSHEELSFIVDSTSSPIAALLAFNAWPAYVQAFIYVAGVPWLATEADRIGFFFKSIPLSFYAIGAVSLTFLISLDKAPFLGRRFNAAVRRARETGELNAPGAKPLIAKELEGDSLAEGYTPHVMEFVIPLALIIGISVSTFVFMGSPNVKWAFGLALVVAVFMSLARGMSLETLMDGFGDGLKGVVQGSVILLLAVIIGGIGKEAGGGIYLIELLGSHLSYWALPALLLLITVVVSFSTGTSWGTYAVAFPLAMPLSWALATSAGLENPEMYMLICFASVLNGSLYGDQCSPISDTTVLSCLSTGCDLMDHVKTQIIPASYAMVIAGTLWTLMAYFFV